MIVIRRAQYSDLVRFSKFDSQDHVEEFFSYKTLDEHQKNFHSEDVVYLSIIDVFGDAVGYFILKLDVNGKSIQFKRILVGYEHLGIGQNAISSMEDYCQNKFKANRIWLDVYEDNHKAKHIYEKLGYIKFREKSEMNKTVLFYEKYL